jgi:two-component system, chemotaxis family, protein-glutamate methylesterase/glutaminase
MNAPADPGDPRLIVVGASAGGVEALSKLVATLPRDLNACVCVVLHLAPHGVSALASILTRSGPLPCRTAVDGEPLRRGEILVAPPDHHLIVDDGHAGLTVGPRENGHRPAIDALFRSAAAARDGDVIGVVLSGSRDDGSAGLAAIKRGGGRAIVQDPDDALYRDMPVNALAHVKADAVAAADRISAAIAAMVDDPRPVAPSTAQPEPASADPADSAPVTSVCPECGGVLSEDPVAGVPQWSCKVGHRYSSETLADAQAEGVEAAMWVAVRALEDRQELLHRMASQSRARGNTRSARAFGARADEAARQAQLVRAALRDATETTLRPI